MHIRTYQPGDEVAQAAIFDEAAGDLPKFKPATAEEIARRARDPEFDPATRFFAEDASRVVGYAGFHANGRVSFPWCRKGQEAAAEPLFAKVLEAMKSRGQSSAFAAYRDDWTAQNDFFRAHGFRKARDMVNFFVDQLDMPTRPGRRSFPLTPLHREDLPAIAGFGSHVLRTTAVEKLEQHLLHNSYFHPDALFVLRDRAERSPVAVGLVIADSSYADPTKVDAAMPCFRLGAFGTEGMQVKRINGLFSFLAKETRDLNMLGLDLMGHAATKLETQGAGPLAAQVASDAPDLLGFYQRYFRRQGSFPVWERSLKTGASG
jgi:hypothetical protein